MTELNLLTLITQAGGTMALAIFAMWMLNRVWEDRVKSAERYATDLRAMWDQMRTVVEENTAAIVRLTERLDRDQARTHPRD
jgi:hypothetical protein